MSFYSDASLVMIPSGYKTSKVYSAVPTDGAGDLSFSRSNDTATRVNSAGLIEKVRTNLLIYSNDFSNAAWGKSNATLTGGQSGYDGTTNGWKLEATATSCYISQGGYSVLRNHSVYVKAGTFNLVSIIVGGYGQGVTFNLTTGAVITNTNSGLYSPVITSVGSGWYRISVGIQAAAPTYGMLIAPNDINGGTIAAGEFIYIQAAQTEYNDIATDYIATTSAAVSVGPVANVPRLDYLNSSCPRLLLEPQRTNSAQYSEQADNAYWLKYQCSITANQAVSPDGYTNADSLTMSTNGIGVIYRNIGTAGAVSCFMKSNSLGTGNFYISVDGVGEATWNANGVKTNTPVAGTSYDGVSYGNGWYRFTYVVSSGNTVNFGIAGGTTGDSILLWGFQNEASASYATSYIPTLGAAVTRGADSTYEESSSALIGQTEGTLFAQFKGADVAGGGASRLSISSGTSANWIFVGTESNDLRAYVRANSSVIFNDTSVPQTGNDKIAIAYKSGSIALYINGAQIATSSSTFTFSATLDDITTGVGGSYSVDETLALEQLIVFPTRLSNSDLAALTA